MNNVARNTGNRKVANDTNDHEDQICGIRGTKKGVSVLINLLNIHPQHILLDLANDASEYVSNGKPKKNIDISGDPYCKCMVQSIKDGEPNNNRTKYGKNNQI